MLIAGSGKAKKSTAIGIAKSMMKEAGVQMFDGKITPERLLTKLGTMPGGMAIMTVVASELSAFLGKQSYNDGMIDTLIKLADCESHPYETQKGVVDLSDKNICFTLFSGSTPVGLSKAIPPQAQEHGFLSRYIWVYSEKSGKIEALANDEDTVDPALLADSAKKRTSLITRLRGFTSIAGRFRWGPARDWFQAYYAAFANSAQSEGEGWPTRRASHLIRLAMVLNIARGDRTLKLAERDVVMADKYLNDVEKDMPKCFAFIGRHINAEVQEKILKVFREKTGRTVSYQELVYRSSRFVPNEQTLKEHIRLLESAGVLGYVGPNPNTKIAMWSMLKEPY